VVLKFLKTTALIVTFLLVVGASAYLTLTLIIKSEDTVVVPDLIGKNAVYVLELLTGLGLNTKVKGFEYSADVPKNHVILQEPDPGTEIKKARDVRIVLSKGSKSISMPNLKGLSIQQARIVLEENGLCQGEISSTYSIETRKDEILAQVPSAGGMINRGGCVNLLVSIGTRPQSYMMPGLIGLSLDDAIPLIESSNLLLGEIKSFVHADKPLNIIVGQDPLSGHRVTEGSIVSLVINRAPDREGREYYDGPTGIGLFRYRLNNGFLKKRIRVRLNSFGVSSDLLNELIRPGDEIWLLIPKNKNTTVFLYEDGELIKTQVFDTW
jgi:serine/threonine-protein kinase